MTAENSKPTRIVDVTHQLTSRGKGRTPLYLCDDDKYYTQRELARLIPMSQPGFSVRLARRGWRHPRILHKDMDSTSSGPRNDDNAELGDLVGLSGNPRDSNLKKITIGTFERGYYA